MNVEREPFESEVAFESCRLREEGQHRVLTKAEVYARGVYLGDRVYLRDDGGHPAERCLHGTVDYDDFVSVWVKWDDGRTFLVQKSLVRWLQPHQEVRDST